jgi:hypothetical protein
MTRRTRRTIFYVLVVLFVVAGSAVVLYADGWRLDFATFRTEKVGGIYVRAFPENASITLDGKPIPNESNFLSHGTLITNLYPKTYTLGLSVPGYDTWKEDAAVAPSLVVEMKYAVLVPQTGTAVATTSDITNFFVIGGDHVDAHANGAITWRSVAIATGTIVSHSTDLKNMIYRAPNGSYFLYDFTTQQALNITAILQKQKVVPAIVNAIMVDPYDDTAALAITTGHLWGINLTADTATAIGAASSGSSLAPVIAASQPFLAWSAFTIASNTSVISVYDRFSDAVTAQSPPIPGVTAALGWINNDTLGVVQNDGSFDLYTISSNSIRPLASDVKSFYPTSDGNLVATLEAQSMEIFDFADNDYYRFNIPNIGSIQSLAWYKDETHLFLQYPGSVAFFDIADTGLTNITTVSEETAASYDPQMNALYVANQGNIFRFDFPN